jgi:hypothetical protein
MRGRRFLWPLMMVVGGFCMLLGVSYGLYGLITNLTSSGMNTEIAVLVVVWGIVALVKGLIGATFGFAVFAIGYIYRRRDKRLAQEDPQPGGVV